MNEPISPPLFSEKKGSFQLIVMGVSGCGKTTVAQALAEHLGYPFIEGDSFHPPKNIEKMRSGKPLNDNDRQGWLETLNGLLKKEAQGAVLSCSALTPSYRETLCKSVTAPIFVYLKGDFDTIWERITAREGHFFHGKAMLQSQFDTLIEPTGDNVITVDVNLPVKEMVVQVATHLKSL